MSEQKRDRVSSPVSEKEAGVAFIDVAGQEEAEADDVIRAETEFTEEEYRRLTRKIDFILIPLLMLTYGLQYSDKTALAAGVVFDLISDTKLKGQEYNNLGTLFYVGYAVAQFPMGWVMQRFPLGKALGTCVILWGGVVLLHAACNNYWQLAIVRVLLGWFESVITPGFLMLTVSWYLRKEQTLRQCLYYAMNTFFAVVFGIGIYFLALNAQQNGGLAAWRVINLFLGGLTVGTGIIILCVVGTPEEVWWLSKREKRMARARIVSNATGGADKKPWKWAQVRECFRDPQYYHAMLFYFATNAPNGGITTFSKLVMKSFGFTSLETILYSMPSGGIACTSIITASILVWKWGWTRLPISLFCTCIGLLSFLFVGLAGDNISRWAKYGVFLPYGLFALPQWMVLPLVTINVAGRSKKTFFAASALFAYCIGNIVGTQMFLASDAPRYLHGLTGCAVCMGFNFFNLISWWWYYKRANKRRELKFVESGLSDEERAYATRMAGEMDQTDMENPHFRYTC